MSSLARVFTEPVFDARLADLFELREECLREFKFMDAYKLDKQSENEVFFSVYCQRWLYTLVVYNIVSALLVQVALEVLPDLLEELDELSAEDRLLALVEGVLAANIFDWGAKACVDLYNNGTILDIYRKVDRGTLAAESAVRSSQDVRNLSGAGRQGAI